MSNVEMRYVDSSRVAADWICPKSRYWGYEHEGIGITGIETNPDLAFGLRVAECVDGLRAGNGHATGHPSSPATSDDETLLCGLLTAYQQHIWPSWLEGFELIGTEVECAHPLSPSVTYMARPDAVLRRKDDQTVWVLSDKTTSLDPQRFTHLWGKAVQNHAECVCVERQLGVTVSGYYTQGWCKGYKKSNTIYSPLAYAWCKEGVGGLTKDQWSETYKYGWSRRRIDAYPGGVEAWVKRLPKAMMLDQFPVAGPIMLRRDLVAQYFDEIVERERAILNQGRFPHHFANCDEYGKYRRPCEFRDCCWAPTIGRDPIGSGLYKKRVPHHELEATHDENPVGQ